MPYLLKSQMGDYRVRDGVEAGDPMYPVTGDGWTPFRHLPKGLEGDGRREPGNSEIAVKEISEYEYEALMDTDPPELLNPPAAEKDEPADVDELDEPTIDDGRQPARMAMMVDPGKLERHMNGGESDAGDAFERDVDESATEPHDTPRADVAPAVVVPSREEVVAAGYSEEAAHGIVAEQAALAAGKIPEDALAAADEARALFREGNSATEEDTAETDETPVDAEDASGDDSAETLADASETTEEDTAETPAAAPKRKKRRSKRGK